MIKVFQVIGQRADLTRAQFLKHLTTKHLEAVDRVPGFRNRVRRYVQNHLCVAVSDLSRSKGLAISFNADEIIEVWWDSVAEMHRASEEPGYAEILVPDMLAFGDVAGAWGVVTNDYLVMQRDDFVGPIKVFVFIKRGDGINHVDFLNRWHESRDQRFMRTDAFGDLVGRFVENRAVQDLPESMLGISAFDVVAELWFDSLRDVTEFADNPDVIAATVGAGADYIDRDRTLIYVGEEQPASAEWLRRGEARG